MVFYPIRGLFQYTCQAPSSVVGRIVRFVVFYPVDIVLNRKAKSEVRKVVETELGVIPYNLAKVGMELKSR